MSRIQTASLVLLVFSASLSPTAFGEQPTAKAISAYSAECKKTGQAMDLIARFGRDYSGLDLSGVDFRGAHALGLETNLQGADFSGANLQGAEFGASLLDGVDFTGANLSKAQFVTASLRQANFQNAILTGAHFQECDLAGAQLQGVKLSDATWARFEFAGADFTGANLSGMSLRGANFKNATLRSANLSGCPLDGADFTGADLTSADLSKTIVRHAIFQDVRGLSSAELSRLNAQTGRWQFELNSGITAFMDSPRFALCLLFVVPLLTIGWHYLNQPRKSTAKTASKSRFRFSIARLFTFVLVVALILGIARWTLTGVYSLMMVSALTMMGVEICYGKAGRVWPSIIFASALGYVALNFGVVFADFPGAPGFSIFNPIFMLTVIFVGPLLMIAAAVVSVLLRPAARTNPPWVGLAGLILWMAGVAWANLYIIAMAAASV